MEWESFEILLIYNLLIIRICLYEIFRRLRNWEKEPIQQFLKFEGARMEMNML